MANIKLTGMTWDTSGVWDATEEKTQADVNSGLKTATTDIESVIPLDLTWTIGKTVASNGTVSTQSTGAMSSQIAVDGGNRVVRFNPTKDTNNVNIIIHVCQYINGVFQSRTSLALSGMTLDASTTSICFNCSRAASTGITMTQQDVDNYFLVKVFRKYELSVDTVSKLRSITITSSIAKSTYGKLLTNLPANIYLWCSGSWWTDAPWSGYFYLWNLVGISTTTFAPMSGQGTQIAINPTTGEMKTRRISSGTWTTWTDNYDSNPVLYSFGDSLTWGAVWDSDQSTDLYQASTENQIPTRIAHAIGSKTFYNLGSSGARFVKQSGDSDSSKTIVDIIKETTLTSADIVTIGGGRNDSATALGDGATATANDGTICGAIVDALSYLTSNFPKLQIVVYGVTPQPTSTSHAPEDIYTRVFGGGWSLATYYTEVAKVCSRFGVPFIDWYDCTLILRWGVLSGGYSGGTQNWSHPLSEDIYKQMGNYIGGRVAAYYEG